MSVFAKKLVLPSVLAAILLVGVSAPSPASAGVKVCVCVQGVCVCFNLK